MTDGWRRAGRTGLLAGLLAVPAAAAGAGPVRARVESAVLLAGVSRLGVNVGAWEAWGASQLGRNVLQNPGFEGRIDRAVVLVEGADGTGFTGDGGSGGWPDGFWRGATFDVRTGRAAGTTGTLADSRRAGADGRPHYTPAAPIGGLAAGDVVALTRVDNSGMPDRWHAGPAAQPVPGETRPGSPGRRSLALTADGPAPADVVTYLDSIGARAGRLLPLDGPWRLAFWSRADGAGATLRVRLARAGGAVFVDRTLEPGAEWALATIDFAGEESGPPGALELRFTAGGTGRVLLDDVELAARAEPAEAEFRAAVADVLRVLRPGYLRDWQGGQGFTLDNRLAPPAGRRTTRCSPEPGPTFFEYGWPAFLDLCRAVGATPWLVVPTSFSDTEWRGLGELLARRAAQDGLREVVLEFGNENWNPVSRPSGIPDPAACGAAAARGFALARRAAPGVLRTAVNGQFANPAAALAFARATPGADLLAVAPYFLFALDAGVPLVGRLAALHPDDAAAFAALAAGLHGGPELAVYEVNLHTTGGRATAPERDATTGGVAAAAALARRVLDVQAAGARRIVVYTLAGFDTWTEDRVGFARLWGIARDLGPTRRLRATGLATALLNRVIAGDRHRVTLDPFVRDVIVAVYRSPEGWAAAIASGRPDPVAVTVEFPDTPATLLPARALTLGAASPWVTNDDGEAIRLAEIPMQAAPGSVTVEVPAAGLVGLLAPGTAP